ncbi:hypothetical protein [Hymenobacter perfusus]|uniref:Uncharacterized protein n=1 Tax=Hymenobacter perfusus TaxID=1236770 RepID=A0A3R9MRA8_9BACT|nr:hypothetical protein [Hymenobacter perfusus]RSK46616.1 hypothetical protein EI293_05515 [Hymenobacter perfusus]
MRKSAILPVPHPDLKRLMLYEDEHGVYLFGYNTLTDAGGLWDSWFETMADAEEAALENYGVASADWQCIADPLPDCQHDWIAPVRVIGRADGQPWWGHLEKLTDGQWQPFHPIS